MNYRVYSDRLILLWFLVSCYGSSVGQASKVTQYTEEDGLPSMTTYEMVQDSGGLLWVGTENGLVSYDGEEFVRYSDPRLQDNDIIEVFLYKGLHVAFMNLSGQFGILTDGGMDVYRFEEDLIINEIFTIGRSNLLTHGNRTSDGLSGLLASFECQNDSCKAVSTYAKFSNLKSPDDSSPDVSWRPLFDATDIDGKIFVHKRSTLTSILNIKSYHLASFSAVKDSARRHRFFFFNDNGQDHICHTYGHYYPVSPEFRAEFEDMYTTAFIREKDFYITISEEAIYHFDKATAQSTVLDDSYKYQAILLDREGNIWASTQGAGLIRIDMLPSSPKVVNQLDAEIVQIYGDSDKITVASYDEILLYNTELLEIDSKPLKNKHKSVIAQIQDELIVVNQNVTYRISDKIDCELPLMRELSKCAAVTENSFFSGTRSGLIKFPMEEKGRIRSKGKEYVKGFEGSEIYCLQYEPSQSRLLVGSTSGAYSYLLSDGAISSACVALDNVNVSDIDLYQDSTALIATKNRGIFIVVDEQVRHAFDVSSGLLSNSIKNLEIADSFLIASTSRGVSRINLHTNEVRNVGKYNGLPADDVTWVTFFDGKVMAAVGRELLSIEMADFDRKITPPVLSLRRFSNNNIDLALQSDYTFAHDENKIDLFLRNVTLKEDKVKPISYRIPQLDSSWITTQDPVIRLPALLHGRYSVEAIGKNSLGIESEKLIVSFTIKPPWYQTWWARILGIIGVVGVSSLIITLRNREIRRQESTKRKYLNQINQIKDQALQLQMNPHFIFNSLNAIQGFIGTDDEEKAMNYLARFARMIRLIFEYSKGSTITIAEELEFIQLYLDLEKLRFKDSVDIHFSASEDLLQDDDIIDISPLLIQPIVENSFKHGLFHKQGKGAIWISYILEDHLLKITVQDDGIGRKAASHISKTPEQETNSGINTTKERLDLMNYRQGSSDNRMFVEDLYDERGLPIGTKTVLYLTTN